MQQILGFPLEHCTNEYVITVGTNNVDTCNDGDNYVMYLWHDVPGLQKFGTFTANNSTDGPFVELGFRPSIVWVKAASSAGDMTYASWLIADGERSPTNPVDKACLLIIMLLKVNEVMDQTITLVFGWICFQMDLRLDILEQKLME